MDKPTLQHQLNMLNGDLTGLNNTIAERIKQLQQLSAEIERLNGAREYQQLIVVRLTREIAALDEATPPTTT